MTAETVVPLRAAPRVDRLRAQRAVAELLAALGYPVEGEHRAKTPQRVASALAEMLTPTAFLPTTFPDDEGYDELVVALVIGKRGGQEGRRREHLGQGARDPLRRLRAVLALHRVSERREQFGHGALRPQPVHAWRCPERDDGLGGHWLSFGSLATRPRQVTG